MPTQDQLREMVAEFEGEYPDSLSDRLSWWVQVLGVDRTRLFRLLGLTSAEATRTPQAALPGVVAAHEDRAEMLDEMLRQLLASYDYNLSAFRTAARRAGEPAAREKRRARHQPGELVPLPYSPRSRARSGMLLNEIVSGGPTALPALLAYIREARSSDGRRGRRAD